MKKLNLDLPAMYGDHHVTEVRRLVSELPGIGEVYASSSFRVLEVSYDPDQVSPDDITRKLDEAHYLGDLMVPIEIDTPAVRKTNGNGNGGGNGHRFRHTIAYAQTGSRVSFKQSTPSGGRPLWPCPGLGSLPIQDEE